jgi:hypothetical protein
VTCSLSSAARRIVLACCAGLLVFATLPACSGGPTASVPSPRPSSTAKTSAVSSPDATTVKAVEEVLTPVAQAYDLKRSDLVAAVLGLSVVTGGADVRGLAAEFARNMPPDHARDLDLKTSRRSSDRQWRQACVAATAATNLVAESNGKAYAAAVEKLATQIERDFPDVEESRGDESLDELNLQRVIIHMRKSAAMIGALQGEDDQPAQVARLVQVFLIRAQSCPSAP